MSPLCMLWLGLPLLPVMSDILTIACCHNNIRKIITNNIELAGQYRKQRTIDIDLL